MCRGGTKHGVLSYTHSDAPAVWEADRTGLSPTQKFLSPDPKQSPFYEYKVLRAGTQIESEAGNLV